MDAHRATSRPDTPPSLPPESEAAPAAPSLAALVAGDVEAAEPLRESRFASLRPISRVVACFFCGVFAFLDLYATQPILPYLERVFGVTKAGIGLTISASTLGVALGAPLLGILGERLNRKRVIVASIFALTVPTFLAATASGLPMLVLWRFLQGLLMPGVFAITIAYVTEEWPADTVALVMSIYVSGTALGGFVGRLVSGLVTEHYGWRASFLVLGVLTLLGGFAVSRWLPPGRRGAHAPTHLPLDAVWSVAAPEGRSAAVLGLLRNPHILVTFLVGFGVLFSLVATFTYVTFYLAAPPFQLSTSAISYIFVVYLAGLVVTPAAGALLPRIGLRYGMAGANMLSGVGVLLTLVPRLPAIGFGLACACSGVFISQACATSYLREESPSHVRSAAVGMYVACYYAGGTAGGVVPSVAWRLDGWTACVASIVALHLLVVVLVLTGWRKAARESPA